MGYEKNDFIIPDYGKVWNKKSEKLELEHFKSQAP